MHALMCMLLVCQKLIFIVKVGFFYEFKVASKFYLIVRVASNGI